MFSINRVVKNVTYIFAGEVISRVLGIITAIMLARYLGPADYGKYTFIVSFAYIFVVISDFGLNELVVREVAKDRSLANKYFVSSVAIKTLLSCLSMGVLILLVYAMGYSHDIVICTMIYSLYILFFTVGNSISAIFRAFEKMGYSSFVATVNSSLGLLFIASLLVWKAALPLIVLAKVISVFLTGIIGYGILSKRVVSVDVSMKLSDLTGLARKAMPFLTIGVIATVFLQADVVLLSKLKGDIYVGYYTPAVNDLFFGLFVIPGSISTVAFPIFSRQHVKSVDALRESVNFTIKILTILGVGISVGTFILAPRIIAFLFGPQYGQSAIVLEIVSLGIAFAFARDPVGFGLAAIGKVKTLMWLNMVTLGILVALSLALIPLYAHVGAAIAFIICIIISFPAGLYFLSKEIGNLQVFRNFLRPLLAALVMCGAIYILRSLNVVAVILIGGIVYGLAVFLIGTFNPSEMAVLKGLIRKREASVRSYTIGAGDDEKKV